MRTETRSFVPWILAVVFLAGPVLAAIPHTTWLMSRMAHKREKLGVKRLKVDLKCGLDEKNRKTETLYLRVPRLVRREHSDGALEICVNGKCVLKRGDESQVRQPEWVFLQYLYFVESATTGERYMRLLKALKINTKVDTLTRAGSRLAIVLGAKEWERDRPQFWLDKDRYLPLRLMTKDDKALVDISWSKWGTRVSGDWFPARMEVRKDGRLIDVCVTEHVDVNAPMPDSLFKFEQAPAVQ
jgi:hypothetical protein